MLLPGSCECKRVEFMSLLFLLLKVYEILDNAVDEAQAGFASKIDVVLHEDDSVSITDDGRGVRFIFCIIKRFTTNVYTCYTFTE